MNPKHIFLSLAVISSLCADEISDYQNEMTKSLNASLGIKTVKGGSVKGGEGEGEVPDAFMDTVIYNDLHDKRSHRGQDVLIQPPVETFGGGIKLATPETDYINYVTAQAKKQQEAAEKAQRAKEAIKKEKPKYFVGGYCVATQRTEIIKASTFGSFNCELDFGNGIYREASIFAGIYPDYQREIAIAVPIYATMPNGQRMEMSGVIMSVNKTTLNIANEVESYKIRRWVAKYGLAFNDIAYRYATMWLSDVRASRTTMETSYMPTNIGGLPTTTPVQNINTEPPKASDYWAAMGAELITRLFAIGAENILEDTSPLFTIYKGQRVWVEGIIDTDNSKIFGRMKEVTKEKIEQIKQNNQIFMQQQYEPINQSHSGGASAGGTPSSTQTIGTVAR